MFRRIRRTFRRMLLLELLGLVALVLWWWMNERSEEAVATTATGPAREPILLESPPAEVLADDDLKRIEGIGPKIARVLKAAGVRTFGQVAGMEADELERIVKEGGVRIAYPETWPEQAALAAQEDWEGLEALQGQLKGGRRV